MLAASSDVAPSRGVRALTVATVAASYALLAVLLTLPVWQSPLNHFVGGGGDPVGTIWGIVWIPFAAGHHLNPLFSDYINAPAGFNMLWKNPETIPMTVLWPVTAVWGPVATYNVVMTGSVVLAAFFAFLAIRRYVPGVLAPAAGGFVYGFSPYMLGHLLGHANLVTSAITPPLALLLIDELVIRQRLRPRALAILLALLASLQFFIAQEILLTEAIAAAALITVLALIHRQAFKERAPYVVRVLLGAAVLSAVLLGYPTWYQFYGPEHLQGVVHPPDIFVTDPLNFIIPGPVELISPSGLQQVTRHFTGNAAEWNAYIGVPMAALLAYTLWRRWKEPLVRVTGITAIVLAVLSLGPHLNLLRHTFIPLPWWLPAQLPVIDNILPNRFMLYVYLAVGIVVAFALQRLWRERRNSALTFAIAALVIAPLVPAFPAMTSSYSAPTYFTAEKASDIPAASVALFEPVPSQTFVDPELWQALSDMRFKLVGGYIIGPNAPGLTHLQQLIERLERNPASITSIDALGLSTAMRDLGVDLVVLAPSPQQAALQAVFSSVLRGRPAEHGGVLVWRLR
jgi:hypothetical protein